MIRSVLFTTAMFIFSLGIMNAQVVTPGTGVSWNADSLVEYFSDFIIEYQEGDIRVFEIANSNVDISPTDELILEDVSLRLGDTAQVTANEATVVFRDVIVESATDTIFPRFRFLDSEVDIEDFELRGGSGISFIDSDFLVQNAYFNGVQYQSGNPSTAVSMLNAKGRILNSVFENCERAAVGSGATSNAAVEIANCEFLNNNVSNGNYPQLNFGNSAEGDSIWIRNNTIIGSDENDGAGGIAILNLLPATTRVIIENNEIRNNRYGITCTGGNIVSSIQNNDIINNNTQGKPLEGGSGINLLGEETNISYIGGNKIEGNLWGLTIQAFDAENFIAPIAYLSEPDGQTLPYPTSENAFIENGNNGQVYAIFNMNDDTIYARNNYWNATETDSIEDMIFHENDDPDLGLVIYEDFLDSDPTITSLTEGTQLSQWNIAPNPVRKGGTIQFESIQQNSQLFIVTTTGNLLTSEDLSAGTNSYNIQLPAGQYYFVLRSDTRSETAKILVVE